MTEMKLIHGDGETNRYTFDDVHEAIDWVEAECTEDNRGWYAETDNQQLTLIDDNKGHGLIIHQILDIENPREVLIEHDGWTTEDWTEGDRRRKVAEIQMTDDAKGVDFEDLLDFCISGDGQQETPFEVEHAGVPGDGVYDIFRSIADDE